MTAALWLACVLFAISVLRSTAPGAAIFASWVITAIISRVFMLTLLPVCEIDDQGLSIRTWTSKRRFNRADLLGCEEVGGNPKVQPKVLIRFKTGMASISTDRGCDNPVEVLRSLARLWNLKLVEMHRQPAGPVEPQLELVYENFHRVLLGGAAVGLAVMVALVPLFWVCLIVAGFCARGCYYCCYRVTTDEQGITVQRPWLPSLKIGWKEIRSVRYWHSGLQGGMKISSAAGGLRVYRWIANYPKFNRLVREHVDSSCLPAPSQLPLKIAMNQSRVALLIPAAVLAGAGLIFAFEGSWEAAIAMIGLPGVGLIAMLAASSRTIEIDGETATDVYREWWNKTTVVYKRAELQDMRLGRQFSGGGLWIRFGQVRLEITNDESAVPPEEVLACLLREWQCQSKISREKTWVLGDAA